MNISSDAGDSLSSSGKDGCGCVYVSVYDATIDKSNGLKNLANSLRAMRTSMASTA